MSNDIIQVQECFAMKVNFTAGVPAIVNQKGAMGAAATIADTAPGVVTLTLPAASAIPEDECFANITVRAADGTTAATSGFGQITHTSDTVKVISLWNAAATPANADLNFDLILSRRL